MSFKYIPITERCNMSCAHCMEAATAEGKDMSWKTYVKAIEVSMDEPVITLGGGEPTLHPQFSEMLDYAISKRPSGTLVSIITNGSNTEISLRLADMTEQGIISAALSQDQWHDPIDPVVVERFKDMGSIHTPAKTNEDVIRVGRGVNIAGAKDKCRGGGLHMDVQGNVFLCDCREECIGTIWCYTVSDLHCERIAPIVKSGEYICNGYCSKRGHVIGKSPEHLEALLEQTKKLSAINNANIAVLELLMDYKDGKVLRWDIQERLLQCFREASGLTAKEFLSIVDEHWGTNYLARHKLILSKML